MVWSGHDERRPDLGAELHMTRRGANQDGGADRCPVPWGSVMAFCDGQGGPVASGSANGSTGGGSPMKKPRTWRSSSGFNPALCGNEHHKIGAAGRVISYHV
jgi:hypothetical protein